MLNVEWQMLVYFAAVVFLAMAISQPAYSQDTQRVIIVTGDDYCPLACNPESGHNGLGYDLAKIIYEPLGWKVEYQFLPWQRGLKYFKQGRVDLLPGVPKDDTPELIGAHFSSVPVIAPPMCFYTRTNSRWHYSGADSLLSGKLGVIAGYYYWPELRGYIKAHAQDGKVELITSAKAMEISVLRLAKKRVDYFAELRPMVEYQLFKQNLAQELREASCLQSFPLYMAFRADFNGAAELNRQWDKQLVQLLASPDGKKLLNHYGLTLKSIQP
jgi:polar amino acid transport system substrate-binding protein